MRKRKSHSLEKLSSEATQKVGSTGGFIFAIAIVIAWLLSGPLFGYSDTWQLAINTGTTIVTFLMVFLIQRSQNKESLAMQIKLNELIASSSHASNRLIDIEDLTEKELATLEKYFAELVKRSRAQRNMLESHSIEEAAKLHDRKSKSLASHRQPRAQHS
jgi:low affinity Fe/Cu permease